MSFYIGFFSWLIYIAACIVLNHHNIHKRKKKPIYFASNQWRVFFGLIFLLIMSADDGFNGIDFAYPRTMIPYIPHGVYIASSFYLFFDAGLNGLRDLPWDYKGENSGWMDSMKLALYYVLKTVFLIAFIWSIVTLW